MLIECTHDPVWEYVIRAEVPVQVGDKIRYRPGISIKFEKNEYEEQICDLAKLADDYAKTVCSIGILSDTPQSKSNEKARILKVIKEEVSELKAWQNGQLREYVPFAEKVREAQLSQLRNISLEFIKEHLNEIGYEVTEKKES